MSDSGEELGGYGGTTPAAAKVKSTRNKRAAAAGPSSSKPPAKARAVATANGRQKTSVQSISSDASETEVQEIVPQDEDDPSDPPPLTRTKRPVVASQRRKTAGTSKLDQTAHKTSSRQQRAVEEADPESFARQITNAINVATTAVRPKKYERELERLQKQNDQYQEQIDSLKRQLEELLKVRNTEPELLMERQREQYEAQLRVKDLQIKELNSALAKQEPLAGNQGVSVLNLLTREAADEEKRILEKEAQHWRKLADERAETITSMEETERQLRADLKAEVERSTSLASKNAKNARNHVSSSSTHHSGFDDPKQVQVLRFYEDLTNIMVTNVKVAESPYLDLEEWHMSCVFSYQHLPIQAEGSAYSLNFHLRFCYECSPDQKDHIESKDQLKESARYTPKELDKEPDEFVRHLGYLGKPFTFERNQLPLFLRSLYEVVERALTGGDHSTVTEEEMEEE